jgi:hypothetical protein
MSVKQIHAIGAQLYRWLVEVAGLHAYRPELHYMRGPGPKCEERRLSRTHIGSVHARAR